VNTTDDYSKAVDIENIVKEIKQLAKDGIVILIPPGSLRGEVVKRLKGSGLKIFVYEKLYNRICNESCDDENIEPVNKDLLVEGKELVEYIKDGKKLKEALELGGKVIVLESTAESLLLVKEIRRELVEEITGEGKDEKKAEEEIEKITDKHIKVLFLPKLYEEKYKDLNKDIREVVEVDYTSILKDFVKKPKGISPKLVEVAKEKQEYVKEGIKAIRVLDPDYTSLKEIYKSLKESAMNYLVGVISSALATIIGGKILAILIGGLLDSTVKTLVEKFLVGIPASILESIIKKKKKEVIESIRELIIAVLQSKEYINDDAFETVVDEVACKWGLSLEGFRTFISNILNTITGKIVTEEELNRLKQLEDVEFRKNVEELVNKRWENYRKELEERLNKLEKEIDEIKRIVLMRSVSPVPLIFDADALPGVNYVNTPLKNTLSSELNETIKNGGGLIVLRGEKGIGKSTAATVALREILERNIFVVEEEQETKVYRPVIVLLDVAIAATKGLLGETKLFITVAKNNGFLPIFYVDPSKVNAYELANYKPESFAKGLQSIIEELKADTILNNTIVLIVLSNDQYKLVENELKGFPTIDADKILEEKKVELLRKIIEKYSGCSQDNAQSLAKRISESFQDNYVLIAVLVADRLKKNGCNVKEVEKFVEDAKGQVHKFILDYIWKGVLGGDEDFARRHAPLLVAIGLLGYHPLDWGKVIIKVFGYMPRDDIVEWFTQPLHGTIYEVIRGITESATKRAFNMNDIKDMCDGNSRGSCKLIDICAEHLIEADVPIRKYKDLGEVADKYAEKVAEKLKETRVIRILIKNFIKQRNGEEKDGTWEIVFRDKIGNKEREIKSIYDEVDALLMMKYLASESKAPSIPESYLHNLVIMHLKSEGGIIPKAGKVLEDIERKGYISELDLFRGLAILKDISSILNAKEDIESIKTLLKLSALLANSKYSEEKGRAKEILYSMWAGRKKINKREDVTTWIADYTSMVLHNPRDLFCTLYYDLQYLPFYDGQPITIRSLDQGAIPDSEKRIVTQYFNTLYKSSSRIGKLALLDKLISLHSGIFICFDPIKPWEYLGQQDSKSFCDLVALKVNELLDRFDESEKNIVASLLYSGLALCYARERELDNAEKYANEAYNAVKQITIDHYKKLRDYMEIWFLRPDPSEELDLLRQIVFWRLSRAYSEIGKKDIAENLANEANRIAKEVGLAVDVSPLLWTLLRSVVSSSIVDMIVKILQGIESSYKSMVSISFGLEKFIEITRKIIEELLEK